MRRFRGQSSVEYAIVFAAFLAMVVGLGAVANLLESGLVLEHALQSASHHLSNVAAAAWADIFLYQGRTKWAKYGRYSLLQLYAPVI